MREGVYRVVPQDPDDMVKAKLLEAQDPRSKVSSLGTTLVIQGVFRILQRSASCRNASPEDRVVMNHRKGPNGIPNSSSHTIIMTGIRDRLRGASPMATEPQ